MMVDLVPVRRTDDDDDDIWTASGQRRASCDSM